jgi:hypothetical protein
VKYLLVHYGKAADSEEERAAGMKAMGNWLNGLGAAVVDGGNPFTGAARTVLPDGTVSDGSIGPNPTGYSILEAVSLADATEMAKTSPLLKSGRQVAIHEIFSAM